MKDLPAFDARRRGEPQNAAGHNVLLHKALRMSVHPLTLVALTTLLVNDHVLRRLAPSALTGKLGDFAWLFFSPVVLIGLLAVFLRRGRVNWTRAVPIASYALVAGVFAAAKTVPAAHDLVVSLASQVFGFQVGWRLDPSDLVALVSLAGSAVLWARMLGTPVIAQPLPAARRAAAVVVLISAALLTVANSPAPDPGIFCLDERSGELDAYAGYSTFRSTDGGLTWASLPNQPRSACPNPWSESTGSSKTVPDPNNEQHRYRITPGESIEYSEDGGASWRVIYRVPQVNEATAAATRKRLSSYATVRPVPLDVKVDRATGNAVFAMGHSGVLVYEPDSQAWREAAVGTYRPPTVNSAVDYLDLLTGEILLGIAVVFLAFCTLTTRILVRGKALWIIVLVAAWLVWAADVFLLPPAMSEGYGAILTYGAMLVLGVVLLILSMIAVVGSLQHVPAEGKGGLWRRLVSAAAAGALFLLPYALWAAGALPQYVLAGVFGTLLAVGAIVAGGFWSRPRQDLAE